MNGQELFKADGKATGVYYCEKCRVCHRNKTNADDCCTLRKCACGAPVKGQGYIKCHECQERDIIRAEAERFDKAEKLTTWDGPVWADGCGSRDGFFPDMDEFYDWTQCREPGEEVPPYVWACDKKPVVSLDIDHILENATQEAYEDFCYADLTGIKELESAMEKFCEINKDVVTWIPNYKKAVLVNAKGAV
jgi:hypothetical protein